jgi:pyruvate, water dikinase
MTDAIRWLDTLGNSDVPIVGGKNASLGEMVRELKQSGIQVPDGFATTAEAYWEFVDSNDLRARIADQIERLHAGAELAEVGRAVREMFLAAELPERVARQIASAYEELGSKFGRRDVDVAVRSSATAEDLPEASFAGQQETFLNVSGTDRLLDACKRCYASLFTDQRSATANTKASTTTRSRSRSGCNRWCVRTSPERA